MIAAAKHVAQSTVEPTRAIIGAAVESIGEEAVLMEMPKYSKMASILQYSRRDGEQRKLPKSLDELNFADFDYRSITGDQFLLYDSGGANRRIVIFGTRTDLTHLMQSDHWFMDGKRFEFFFQW